MTSAPRNILVLIINIISLTVAMLQTDQCMFISLGFDEIKE